MAASESDISSVRRMIADYDVQSYSDAELAGIIEKYPLETGYDLNAAARDLWELKAASFATSETQFSADGLSVGYGDRYNRAMAMAKHYDSKANSDYSNYGFGTIARDDVDPLGNGDYRIRPIL